MGISITVEHESLSDAEKNELVAKANRMKIAKMTPEIWHEATGGSQEDLADFVKQHCRIHSIRRFLAGEEQLGTLPKLIIIDSPEGSCLFLVSLRPDYNGL